jgi:hypothetical protein
MLLLVCGFSQAVYADYLGEYCLETEEPGEYFKLGITRLAGGHYLVNGTLITLDSDVSLVHGTMEIIEGQVIIHFTNSRVLETDNVVNIGTLILDLGTLNGIVEGISISADRINPGVKDYSAFTGNIFSIPCP